ncbi:KilA-N domain-containing protein [Komagataeibacter melaceti]|uniref:KilA-N domain-containing protein n=1 Tax=Komagataeibacter melaceti TaxID=2766577 RepID=A0A371YWU7_9PROT|nr:KilA-N domain-containing protein [Komagataeibacter melaceti]RFD18700.1 KilA-N domain-containing protein [Komagataeibacter melaceti]
MSTNKGVLVYNEKPINFCDEMLCLTDMWKAAGKPASSSPAEWQRSADAEKFIEFISETQNMGISHVIKSNPGKGGGTWAYWQIAFAYAKKLSPEFHAWVNQAAREKMEALAGKQKEKTVKRVRKPSVLPTFRTGFGIAKILGLDDNQASIYADRYTNKKCNESPLTLMGITHHEAPENTKTLNASEIAERLDLPGSRPGIAGNQLLKEAGLHTDSRDKKNKIVWTPTESGMQFARLSDTGKAHSDGSVQTYRWSERVLAVLSSHLAVKGESVSVPFAKKPETATV